MSSSTLTSTALDFARRVGEEVAASLPGGTAWTAVAEETPTLPDNARVVVAWLGSEARLALIMASPFARNLIVGPPPADSLEEALQQSFAGAASMIAALIDSNASLGPLTEGAIDDATVALGGSLLGVRLIDGETHVATLVIASAKDLDAQPDALSPVFEQLPEGTLVDGARPVSMLADVEMGVTVELGRARLTVAEILSLTIGSVVELDRIAGSPVDVLVNGTLIARGEVVVVDEEFGVRVSEVIGYQPTERLRR